MSAPRSCRDLTRLIDTAERRGFSRKAKHVRLDEASTYGLLAYLYEATPEPSWMCLVIQVDGGLTQAAYRPEISFGRLDVALADFATMRRAKRPERDQMLHWMAWLAYGAPKR
ncbi:hypothetical protein Pen02_80830 [Plantactinospora endophytica]|uniref:Uncharacterized protein n=1 Tax=Plantactinospora endophytica TaxID=673535 RepID=A0ABQ4EEJ3_9ACTN|nr:hypothetical protein Pen02_80830 [Plantactinospora endophytica]